MNTKWFPFLITLIAGFLAFHPSFAGREIKYPVSAIPDSLKKSAKAVIRNETIVFEIKNIEKATLKVKYAVTILKKSGISQSYFVQAYDRFKKIANLKGDLRRIRSCG